jgi:hypothetical protein
MPQYVLAAEFRRYAEEARHMSETVRRAEDKQHWAMLAERWMRCAERAEAERSAEAAVTRRKLHAIQRKRAAADDPRLPNPSR